MRINEILTESQHLEEGPILNKIGSAVGKAAGGVAKGVGALAGGIAGIGAAAKKGFAAGKKTVAGADDEDPAADNTANAQPTSAGQTAAPAAQPAAQPAAPAQAAPAQAAPAQAAPAKAAPAQTGSAFSKLTTAAAGGAPAAPAEPAAGGTQYAQVKANIDKLDKKGKQRILALLQKEVGAAPAKPAADPGAAAMGQMAGQLAKGGAGKANTMANAPVSKTNTAKPGNPNAAPKGNFDGDTGEPISDKGRADVQAKADFDASPKGQALKAKWDAEDKAAAGGAPAAEKPGFLKTATDKIQDKNKNKRSAKPSQAEIDASRDRLMGVTSDSIIRTRPMMAESFSLFRKK